VVGVIRSTVELAVRTSGDAPPFAGGIRQIDTHVGTLGCAGSRVDDENIRSVIRRTVKPPVRTSGDAMPFESVRQIQPKRLKPGGSHLPIPFTSETASQLESNA